MPSDMPQEEGVTLLGQLKQDISTIFSLHLTFLRKTKMTILFRVVPGTASRLLASAMQKRPLSRGGIGLQTPLNIADRPVTQQGLSGLRTGAATGKKPKTT